MDEKRVKALLENYRQGKCTPEERKWVEQWYVRLIATGEWNWSNEEKEKTGQLLEARLLKKINAAGSPETHRLIARSSFRWWAAASILILLAAGLYGIFSHTNGVQQPVAGISETKYNTDISPARQRIILTLSDGSTRVIDSIANNTVIPEAHAQAIKKDGLISYLGNSGNNTVFNTIRTEKGRTFHLQLADGTNVWLDAVSSIRFPASFPGNERRVEVTGQVYFEVAKDPKKPFRVSSENQAIEVLGTHFNVNTYNQQYTQTTLLEGAVKITQQGTGQPVFIKPGQQAASGANGKIKILNDVDLNTVVAWKEGRFLFNGNSIEEIMNQVSRWYNIDVIYRNKIDGTFVADIKRDLPVSKLLALLEMTKLVRFKIEGNRVIVMK